MLAKIQNQKGYRFIDIGNDFHIISENIDSIRNNYCKVIRNIVDKLNNYNNKSQEEVDKTLYSVYLHLFTLDVYCEFIYNCKSEDFYEELKKVDTEEKLIKFIYMKNSTSHNIVSHVDLKDEKIGTDYDRMTAIKYTDEYGKETIEIFSKKNIYIVNENGKTVETYRNNMI